MARPKRRGASEAANNSAQLQESANESSEFEEEEVDGSDYQSSLDEDHNHQAVLKYPTKRRRTREVNNSDELSILNNEIQESIVPQSVGIAVTESSSEAVKQALASFQKNIFESDSETESTTSAKIHSSSLAALKYLFDSEDCERQISSAREWQRFLLSLEGCPQFSQCPRKASILLPDEKSNRQIINRISPKILSEATFNHANDLASNDGEITLSIFNNRLSLKKYEQTNLRNTYSASNGIIFNTGLSVQTFAWNSTSLMKQKLLAIAGRRHECDEISMFRKDESPCEIQIWAVDLDSEICTETVLKSMVIADWGCCWQLEWCAHLTMDERLNQTQGDRKSKKRNAQTDQLGVLCGVFQDGTIHIFEVPADGGTFRIVNALMTIDGNDVGPSVLLTSFIWTSSDQLITGCSNGFLCTWTLNTKRNDTGKLQLANIGSSQNFRIWHLTYCNPVHTSYVNNLIACDMQQSINVLSTSLNGTVRITDYNDYNFEGVSPTPVSQFVKSVAWNAHLQSVVGAFDTTLVSSVALRKMAGNSKRILVTRGNVCDIACSRCHPIMAVADSDGSVTTANSWNAMLRARSTDRFQCHKLFQMDFDQHKNEYRYIECIAPSKEQQQQTNKKKAPHLFPPEIRINKLSWCQLPGSERWLASGMECGLVRLQKI